MNVNQSPTAGLRSRALATARAARSGAAPTFTAPYAEATDRLNELLRGLAAESWRLPVVHGWTVQDLCAHLAATDSLILDQLRAVSVNVTVAERTSTRIAAERAHPPDVTRSAWYQQSRELVATAEQHRDSQVELDGARLSVHEALLQRGFETWIHAEDIAGVVGAAPLPPSAANLWQLANHAMNLVPHLLARTGRTAPGRSLRVVLTGAGGDEWLVPAAPGGQVWLPDAELTLDVMDFCLLVGDRLAPDAVAVQVAGDDGLAADLLVSANAFAGP